MGKARARRWGPLVAGLLLGAALFSQEEEEFAEEETPNLREILNKLALDVKGFLDLRAGVFTQRNRHIRRSASLGEVRFPLELGKNFEWIGLKFKGDSLYDAVQEKTSWEIREGHACFTLPEPLEDVDCKIGRQILTWAPGTCF